MRVGQRLFLAVVPAIVGLLTVAALVYFGEYARQAPEWLVLVAVTAALGSAVLAWRNTRYVTQRIEQLGRGARSPRHRAGPCTGRRNCSGPRCTRSRPPEPVPTSSTASRRWSSG